AGAFTRYLRILSKNFGVGLSAFLRVPRRFRRYEPPIVDRLICFVNTFFQGRFTEVKRCCRCRFVVCPERLSSLRAAYYVRLFVSVNTFFRGMLPSLRVGVHRGEDRVAARERILKTSENSSRLFVDLFHRRVINACCSSTRAAARALRVLPQAC
ncbi:hypothetical protein, partial [Stenotrophomonas sp. HMWF003]|uniref:hypothetical protein n=1 Tax=Stenotrophomonas sp. HMWF003 TaxID=2056840 RepID=UPI001C63A43D